MKKIFVLHPGLVTDEGDPCGPCGPTPCSSTLCWCYNWYTSGFFFVACAMAGALEHQIRRTDGYKYGFQDGHSAALREQWYRD